jgi:V/A-type H+/Na+-transporting ATPase subunit E
MPLIDILDKIKKDTDDFIAKLEREYKEKRDKLEKESKEKQKKIDEDIFKKIEEKSKKIIEKAKNLAEREEKNKFLLAKRELIDNAMTQAIENLSKSKDYETIITNMLKVANIEDENVVIIPSKGREEVTKNAIKNSGRSFYLSDKSSNIKGGFILKTEKIEIDNSFETLINEQLRDNLEIKINKLLFQ